VGTRPPNRRDHEIARLDALDEIVDLANLGERLVTEHQAIASWRGSTVLEGGDLPIVPQIPTSRIPSLTSVGPSMPGSR